MQQFDFIIIGAGLVGLATAFELQKIYPQKTIAILEKESEVGKHQSGRNSGVMHTGIYYKPHSQKAKLCTHGRLLLEEYCKAFEIPFEICGKVIVATRSEELPILQTIYERGGQNQVECRIISSEELADIEPHVRAIKGIFVPRAGIVDYPAVSRKLAEQIEHAGGRIFKDSALQSCHQRNGETVLCTATGEFHSNYTINCAGLYSDHVAKMFGIKPKVQIIPFRGEYYKLKDSSCSLCKNLIYPVPDLHFPFLGVHFTRMIAGGVECGPNAVLAMAREGYNWRTWNMKELIELLSYRGFQKLGKKYLIEGLREIYRSLSRAAFVRSLQSLVPEITCRDIETGPSGVRAQAVTKDGILHDDFLFEQGINSLHVLNAPSPAATACFAIARSIAERAISSATH